MNYLRSVFTKVISMLLLCLFLGACGSGSSDSDAEETSNVSPTVDAGADQAVESGATVSLSASITDDDTDYAVSWTQTSGEAVSLSDSSAESISFTAPDTISEQTLVFEVSVDDGTNAAVTDSVTITVSVVTSNDSPIVDAGTNQTVESGATVTLSASISDDDTDYAVSWAQTSGNSTVSLTNSDTESATFTAPTLSDEEILIFEVSVDDGTNAAVTDSVVITVTAEIETSNSVWIINESGEVSAHILDSTTGVGVEVDVQSVTAQTIDNVDYTVVNSQGIPSYEITATQDIIDGLTSRPKADSDFVTGSPTVEVGDTIAFGQDIGYDSNNNCTTDYGYGYWPPGPECPTQDERTVYLPTEPQPATEECDTGLSKMGIMVNGSSIYNWEDGFSYTSDGYWLNLAPEAEVYDIDVCGGHAAGTDYHHHLYSSCLAELLGDDGSGHSPIWGYAADGYPIYGPWESDGELAVSAWVTRDYNDSLVGCSDGTRSCQLVDQYDISLGTEIVTQGPDFDDTTLSLSSNEFVTVNGFYFEDYYWDSTLTEQGGVYLDQHNGHTDEERGYHYHITITIDDDDNIKAAFPYIIGPRYAGQLDDNTVASCSTGEVSGGGPGAPPSG
ncbi:PKD domain-containing protein [Paraglaciecola sp. 2405UD69-4]|uniref:PKD domain-containing protein n=1 Tax=Paraglaciecola sp. 2405UD69-4 TaxID=3391836 RepID=UPI0039C92BE1